MKRSLYSQSFRMQVSKSAIFIVSSIVLAAFTIGQLELPTGNHAASGISLQLAHHVVEIQQSSFPLALEEPVFQDLNDALAFAAGASRQQLHDVADFIFNKAKYLVYGSHSNRSTAFFSTKKLGSKAHEVQFFVQFGAHCDVQTLIALQHFSGGLVVTRVQERLFLAIGDSVFHRRARMFPGVLWVQEREHSSKIGRNLLQHLHRIKPTTPNPKAVKIIAECWFDGCGFAAAALKSTCPDLYVHPSIVEGRCSELSLRASVDILAANSAVNVVELKREMRNKNFGGRAIVGSGPDALFPETSLVLKIESRTSLIGVADSGIDMNNCFFYDENSSRPWNNSRVVHTYAVNPCEVCGTCCGEKSQPGCSDEVNACGNFREESYHGSHVCGTIAGVGPTPVSYGNGIAAGARIFFLDVENVLNSSECYEPSGCESLTPPSDLFNLFTSQFRAGARVSSNSYGGTEKGIYSEGCRSIDAFVYANPTFIVVWSAGNAGGEAFQGTVEDEANCKNCLSVGATQQSDELYRSMHAFDDGGSFCKETSTNQLIDPCCNSSITCINRCCDYTSLLNMSLSCCAAQTTCSGKDACSVATGNIRSARNVASFSSRGPSLDGRFKPDIVAPGESIMSAATPDQSFQSLNKTQKSFTFTSENHCAVPNNTRPRTTAEDFNAALAINSGTSFAAPLVAGAVEKIRQYFIQGYYPKGIKGTGLSFEPEEALVRAVIVAACVSSKSDSKPWGVWTQRWPNDANFFRYPIPDVTPNFFYGHGLPVLDNAVYMNGSSNGYNMQFVRNEFGSYPSTFTHKIACNVTTPLALALTIVWTDPPGNVISQSQIVNDIDLIVLVPGSSPSQLFGNMRPYADTLNTVEKVITSCPASGEVTAIVTLGKPLATASQVCFLVANGPVLSITPTIAVNFSSGRSYESPAVQQQPCSQEPVIQLNIKFMQPSSWMCSGPQGEMDCSLKRSAFSTTLAQLLRSPALGITVTSSDSEGIYAALQCTRTVQTGRMVYITAASLLAAIRILCSAAGSVCGSDDVLSAVDWTTLKVVPPEAASITMTYTAYKADNCTDALSLVGNNSSPSPFAFDDRSCSPGPIFENVQLFFRASDCTDNAAFIVSKRFPSCSVSQGGALVSAQANYPQRACVRAETLFKTAMVQDYAAAEKKRVGSGRVPESFTFSCQRFAQPPSTNACANGKLCLAISDTAAYSIAAASLFLHVAQTVAWAIYANRKRSFSRARLCIVGLLPILGLVLWFPLRCCSKNNNARGVTREAKRNNLLRLIESELESRLDSRGTQ